MLPLKESAHLGQMASRSFLLPHLGAQHGCLISAFSFMFQVEERRRGLAHWLSLPHTEFRV